MKHESHPGIVKRLRRAEGHLRSVVQMFADGRDCLDISQQLHAVEMAIAGAKRELIHDHIEHCLEDGVAAGSVGLRQTIGEMKSLAKYL